MRTKQEIKQAVAILRHKADRLSLVMAEVLMGSMTEQQVFQKYVMNVAEADRDESVFFAARDAARFQAGHIGLEELIPDVQSMTTADFVAAGALGTMKEPKKERQTVSLQEFEALKRKVNQLEGLVDDLCKERRQRAEYQKRPADNHRDFISQQAAISYVGCSRATLGNWQQKGYITVYRRSGRTYYSKSELEASPVVQNFIELKEDQSHGRD